MFGVFAEAVKMLAFYMSMVDTDEEKQQLRLIYEKYHDYFFRVAFRYLKSKEEAEDAVHNLFLKIIVNKLKILGYDDTNLLSWSVITIRNLCLDILRSRNREGNIASLDDEETQEPISDDIPIDTIVETRETYELLKAALSELSETEQLIMEMKYVENLTFAQIAQKVNMSNNQINAVLRRAREKMRNKLKSTIEEAEVTI
jgi:RNA polymerase sigma-70 factor (ECF subfamily)